MKQAITTGLVLILSFLASCSSSPNQQTEEEKNPSVDTASFCGTGKEKQYTAQRRCEEASGKLQQAHQDELGNYQEAIENYSQASTFNPQDAKAYYNRGLTHSRLGKYEEAIQDYNQAIALDDQLALAYYSRGLTHYL